MLSKLQIAVCENALSDLQILTYYTNNSRLKTHQYIFIKGEELLKSFYTGKYQMIDAGTVMTMMLYTYAVLTLRSARQLFRRSRQTNDKEKA